MGLQTAENCIFTDLPANNIQDGHMRDAIEYWIDVGQGRLLIRLTPEALHWNESNEFFKEYKHIFRGLILNNNWFEDQKTFITIDKLKELLPTKSYPKTPTEKADYLFQYYLSMQKEDGEVVDISDNWRYFTQVAWKQLYFKSYDELLYYSKHLDNQRLIDATFQSIEKENDTLLEFFITVDGLNYGIRLQAEGEKSNLCFIAMAFKDETKIIRTAIKEALWETGFKEILMDELNIESDRTINDEIIANLKKCKFCIADFSYHSNGVYFESGFALGQGKKVIYTCLDREFNQAHFDIKPLQHIIYPTAEELKVKLKYKIEAWIK